MIVFTGVAGSGKSMQGRLLADEMGYPWLSTGEFLRMVVRGERRKEMLEGSLLSDDEVIEVVSKVLSLIEVDREFVLDGFPRSEPQAKWLLNQIDKQEFSPTRVIHMVANKATVRARLLERGRKDDHPEAIDARFDEYEEAIRPILDMFREQDISVIDIDAEQDIEVIHQQIKKAI